MKLISLLLLAVFTATAFAAPPFDAKNDKLRFGIPANTAADKILEFNKGSGATNPKIKFDGTAGVFKFSNDGTNFSVMGSGGSNGSFVWELPDSNSPSEVFTQGLKVLDFSNTAEQEVWAFVRVPDAYLAGTQIFLKGLAFFTSVNTGNVLFQATTYLVRNGSSSVSGTPSSLGSYTSTNAQVAVSATANQTKAVGNVDLTDNTGSAGVPVAAGDYLAIQLVRKTSSETSGAAADARLIKFSGAPSF